VDLSPLGQPAKSGRVALRTISTRVFTVVAGVRPNWLAANKSSTWGRRSRVQVTASFTVAPLFNVSASGST
jgi:hypothetical protein